MATQLELKDMGPAVTAAVDKARQGEDVTIAEGGHPIARIVPISSKNRVPQLGALKGLIEIADDFDAPLPEEELREWEK
jgi:antitoxin (DNA-binding transcriptional repressor) of toxin-antitoxin stability system